MKRRIFLKLLSLSPIVPSVLMAKETECVKFPEPTYSCNGVRHTLPKIWTERWDCQTKQKLTFDENMRCVKYEEFDQLPFVVFSGEQSYIGDVSFVERKILA